MEFELLAVERTLPVYVVSVRLAATIFAWDGGEWAGRKFDGTERAPFLELREGHPNEEGETDPHGWEDLDLHGAPLQARQAIETLLLRDIDAGRLLTLYERRDLEGALIAAKTLLDVGKAQEWAEVHGLEPGDSFNAYADGEGDIAVQAVSAIRDGWEKLQDPDRFERRKQQARALNEEAILDVLRENERLRATVHAPTEKPLDARERTSLLCIIGALAKETKLDLSQPMKAGNAIAAMMPGVTLSVRAIGEHLKAVREAMDSRTG